MEWINLILISSFTAVLASPLVSDVVTASAALSFASSLVSLITVGINLGIFCLLFKVKKCLYCANETKSNEEKSEDDEMDFSKFRTNEIPVTQYVGPEIEEEESEYEYVTDEEENIEEPPSDEISEEQESTVVA